MTIEERFRETFGNARAKTVNGVTIVAVYVPRRDAFATVGVTGDVDEAIRAMKELIDER